MEDLAHCMIHRKRPAEYVCQACKKIPMCEMCKLEHANDTGHAPESYKELGLALMRQRMKGAGERQASEQAKELRKAVKEFGDGLLREIDKFQLSLVLTEEKHKMQKLEREGRYVELYYYARSLPVGGVKNEAAMEELNKRLLTIIGTAPDRFKKVRDKVAAEARAATQYKPIFATYKNDEVFVLKDESKNNEEKNLL